MNLLGAAIFLLAILLFSTFLNWYVFQAVKTVAQTLESEKTRQWIIVAYWMVFGGISVWYIWTFVKISFTGEFSFSTQTMLNVFLTVVVTQLVCIVFYLQKMLPGIHRL